MARANVSPPVSTAIALASFAAMVLLIVYVFETRDAPEPEAPPPVEAVTPRDTLRHGGGR